MSDKTRQFLIVFLVISSLVMVGLAVYLPLGGQSTAAVSAKNYTYITPSGWAFSIWSLIYAGLAAFAVWQALPAQREDARLRKTGPWIMGIAIANGIWLVAWQYEFLWAALGVIIFYLFCLVRVMDALTRPARVEGRTTFWLGFVVFSIYTGWLTVATTLNASAVLKHVGFNAGLSEEAWGVVILAAAFGIAWMLYLRWRSVPFILVICWAYAAIAAAHPDHLAIQVAAGALGASALAIASLGWMMGAMHRVSHVHPSLHHR